VDEEGLQRSVESADVNQYLRMISGQAFTAKDFRTWHGTVRAARALVEMGEFASAAEARRNIVEAINVTAQHLGNTAAICRKSHVHPAVLEAYLDGTLSEVFSADVTEVVGAG
jgi:DNA topoisomerase-1